MPSVHFDDVTKQTLYLDVCSFIAEFKDKSSVDSLSLKDHIEHIFNSRGTAIDQPGAIYINRLTKQYESLSQRLSNHPDVANSKITPSDDDGSRFIEKNSDEDDKAILQYFKTLASRQVPVNVCTYAKLTAQLVETLLGIKELDECDTTNKNVFPNLSNFGMSSAISLRISSIQFAPNITEAEAYLNLYATLLNTIENNLDNKKLNIDVANFVCDLINNHSTSPALLYIDEHKKYIKTELYKLVKTSKSLTESLKSKSLSRAQHRV